MTEPNDSIAESLDRRRMLQVVGAAGAAGVLVACGGGTSDSGDGGTDPDRTAPDNSSNDQDTGTGEPAEPDESGDDGEGDGDAEALAATGDVPVGGGVIGAGVVVTQPAEGDFRAFSSTCTHQGCTVSDVSDGIISCPCHGSQYSAEDGSVQRGPSTSPLPEVEITVDGGQIMRG